MKMTEDFKSEDLLFMMKKINLKLSAQMELRLKRKDITGVQVYFLVYILRHHPKGTLSTTVTLLSSPESWAARETASEASVKSTY